MTTKKDIQSHSANLYMPAGFYMLRAPALPAHTFQQLSVTQKEDHVSQSNLDTWLQNQRITTQQQLLEMSIRPQIEQAIAIASSSLHAGLVQLRSGDARSYRQEKAYSGLMRYIIRMSTRPTPFGLFSGIALGFFGAETTGQLDIPAIGRFRTRPDMNWLLALLKHLESSPALATQLSVQTNQLAYIIGDRVYLSHADAYGQKQNKALSLRATSVVRKVFELAYQPLPYTALRDTLMQEFSGATIQQVEGLLWQLWEQDMLISTLHPPLTNAQPARYVYQQLETLKGVEEMRQLLGEMLTTAAEIDTSGIGSSFTPFKKLTQIQQTLLDGEKNQPQIQVDSTLALRSSTLHKNIGTIAAQTAEILLRFTPHPQGSPELQDYRQQFLEKYSLNAEVSLLELLSPEIGLDAPAGYTQPPRLSHNNSPAQRPVHNKRELALQMLVQNALNSHILEVELHETDLSALETWSPRMEQAPRSLEIYLQIQATSREDLDKGKFCAIVSPNPGSPNGGRSFGRFFDLFADSGTRALQELLAREESLEPETVFAELSYQHSHARTSNIAIRPGLRSYEIAVGPTASVSPEYVLNLDDLVVGVQDERFYLRSLRLNKKVIVCQLHMLNIAHAPNVCRFLTEIASDGLPMLSSFNWGTLSTAPFLPRITIKQESSVSLVLSPARWNLQLITIKPQGNGNAETCWFAGLQQWRHLWRVPRFVYLVEADNRLLLDLEHPLMVTELFKALNTLKEGQQVLLQELLPDFEHLWLTDTQGAPYFSEIVVPLLRRDAAEVQQNIPHQGSTLTHQPLASQNDSVALQAHNASLQVRIFHPGSAWNYVKIYCTPVQQEEIIAGPLRDFVQQLREQQIIDRWFFLRYADPQPHLRLRIHSNSTEQIQPAITMLLSWCHQLATRGLIQRYSLDLYEREVARYGGPMAIDILEQVFSIDSDICSSLTAAQYTRRLTLDPFAIAVFSLDRLFATWNYDIDHRLRWLQKRTDKYAFSKDFHHERKKYYELLSPRNQDTDSNLITQRNLLHKLISPLEEQLTSLAVQIHDLAHASQLWVTEDDLLAHLAHMHKIRLIDLDRSKEQKIYAFWRSTLESIRLRA